MCPTLKAKRVVMDATTGARQPSLKDGRSGAAPGDGGDPESAHINVMASAGGAE
jgi:hypothetical protein